ncbi:phage tail protein [Arsenophonus apicola]|uniref:Phage tail protein n=1 Tax=Arsenophonus apicola TaxID=2879119 RepID=A0ABY8P6F1_9GAMM|nr:phage tail protein [Arsenophonus apicola]WGO84669.1 phage tail protein [Arsenophonus apicola]
MKYFALLTKSGENLLAQATVLGSKIELTHMAVGDGGGSLPTPDTNQTKLIGEKRRAAINTLFVDEKNHNQIIVEQIIPEAEGGWWIRELGLFDKAGNLIAVANCPETYKPQLAEGSGRTQAIRMVLVVSNTESVTLKLDPAVILATREFVDKSVKQSIEEHEKNRRHPDANISAKGFVQLADVLSADNTKAVTPKLATEINQRAVDAQNSANAATIAATNANNNANGRVPNTRKVNNKTLNADIALTAGDVDAYNKQETDTKVADAKKAATNAQSTANSANTAATNANNNANGRVPNTRKINNKSLGKDITLNAADLGAQPAGDYATNKALVDGLNKKVNKQNAEVSDKIKIISSGDCARLTLQKNNKERIDIETLQSDSNMLNIICRAANGKNIAVAAVPKKSGTLISTANTNTDHNGCLRMVGNNHLNDYPVGSPIPWPQATAPTVFLICNGQAFNKTTYPLLAKAYPSGKLQDMRAEFIRGLDNGRGIDINRSVLSAQGDAIRNITGQISAVRCGGGYSNVNTGAFSIATNWNAQNGMGRSDDWGSTYSFNAGKVVPIANENRPRNIAFLYIVRAA